MYGTPGAIAINRMKDVVKFKVQQPEAYFISQNKQFSAMYGKFHLLTRVFRTMKLSCTWQAIC